MSKSAKANLANGLVNRSGNKLTAPNVGAEDHSSMEATSNKSHAGSASPATKYQYVLLMEICVNILSVVGIIIMNKRIQIHHSYPFMVALSSIHFFWTSLALKALHYCRMFEKKDVPLKYVVFKAALDCASTTFMNLNLANNSVGTYQISKLSLIPVTVLTQYAFLGEKISACTAQVLTVLCLAIGIATVTDINITPHGLFWGIAAILATVYSQILTTLYLRNLGCTAVQLLLLTSPWISGFMLLLVPVLDGAPDLATPFRRAASPAIAVDIALSCVLAIAVNLTNYLVLGKTSPLTYQVLGHLKGVLVLAAGYVLLDRPTTPRNAAAVAVAVAAVAGYASVRGAEAAPAPRPRAAVTAVAGVYAAAAAAAAAWPVLGA